MSRIDGGSPRTQSAQVNKPEAPKAQAPAPKAQAPAAKNTVAQPKAQGDQFDTKPKQSGSTKQSQQVASKPVGAPPERITQNFSASGRNQIKQLANAAHGSVKVTTNKDGSETRKLEGKVNNGQSKAEVELTTSKGLLRAAQTKYSKTNTATVPHGTDKKSYTAEAKSDVFGRTTSSETTEKTTTRGTAGKGVGMEYTHSQKDTSARDQWGIQKDTSTESHKYKTQSHSGKETTQGVNLTQTTDSRGNKSNTREDTKTVKNGDTTTTTTTKHSSGTELTTASSNKVEDGKWTVGESADWKKNKFNNEKSINREIETRPSKADSGHSQANTHWNRAQTGADVLGAAGVKTTLAKGEIPKDQMKEDNWIKGADGKPDPNTFVGTRHGEAGKYEVTLGADGLKASGNYEKKAGVYAEKKSDEIKEGEAGTQYALNSKAEIGFSAEGKATINSNGVDVSGGAKVGVTVEASATGKAQTKSVEVAGVKMNASAEGTAKVSAQATAEAKANVKVTGNPPTAIVEGSVGASAVAKAEAEAKLSAGPFSVKGNIYGSAGAEATAKGSIGYEDGKIKLSGSLGAAVGLGAGGGVAVEVDVKAIGDVAKNTATAAVKEVAKAADVNGDGKLGFDDAKAAAKNVVDTAKNTVNAAKNTVSNAASTVKGWFGW